MLRDADLREERRFHGNNLCRCVAAVKLAEQCGDPLDNGGIGIAREMTTARAELARKPEPREAALDTVRLDPLRLGERRMSPATLNHPGQPRLRIADGRELRDERLLISDKSHLAES